MLTVPEAARRTGRSAETVRRWIRAGRLRWQKVGTQHLIEESDLEHVVEASAEVAIPEGWRRFADGTPQSDWERIVRRSRQNR